MAFACPPDCGHCCTHLEREPEADVEEFRALLREEGVYHCGDGARVGLALSNAEADALRAEAARRAMPLSLHPRTYLLETRRRLAVVLDWHMPYASCPFYADFRCTAYELRPLVCRAYPVLRIGRGSLAPECPKTPAPATQLRAERSARRAIDEAQTRIDQAVWDLLARRRFARGLTAAQAEGRLGRYRLVAFEELMV